jgi:hypothetical protein
MLGRVVGEAHWGFRGGCLVAAGLGLEVNVSRAAESKPEGRGLDESR